MKPTVRSYYLLKQICILCFSSFITLNIQAQGTYTISVSGDCYFVYFKCKAQSAFSPANPGAFLSQRSLQRRQRQGIMIDSTDLPVNRAYTDSLGVAGIQVLFTSKWMNAALVNGTSAQLSSAISRFPFVKPLIMPVTRLELTDSISHFQEKLGATSAQTTPASNEAQFDMLCINNMQADGIYGDSMLIAIFDAGFNNAPNQPVFQHIYNNNKVWDTYDFVSGNTNVYDDDVHGTEVWSELGGYLSGQFTAGAYNAAYLLYRSENVFSEKPIEEVNWLLAAERADSIGADIISSSLGYTTFDNPAYNHNYADMNGKTTIAARAATLAARKGILCVIAAGNDGDDPWKYISTPGDADSILTIGAVDLSRNRAAFSSQGPTSDGRIKPDLMAPGANVLVANNTNLLVNGSGTSFATPMVAGLAAGLWQNQRNLKVMELIHLMRNTADRAHCPDTLYGYGIPCYSSATGESTPLNICPKPPVIGPIPDTFFYTGLVQPGRNNPLVNVISGTDAVCLSLDKSWTGSPAELAIFDLQGKLALHLQIEKALYLQSLDINGQTLAKGMYVCKLSAAGRQKTFRFVNE